MRQANDGMPDPDSFYVTGGALPQDAPSYVERAADRELLGALGNGEFCYLLDTRQVGKSSLMFRTAARLRARGVHVAILDLTRLGQSLTVEQWYYGLLLDLGAQLGLRDPLRAFWQQNKELGALHRWMEALRQVLLPLLKGRLVLFVDEIDNVLNLSFSTDEFFAGIRECYNRRAQDPEMRRLAFCLLGSSTPDNLIQDVRTTPFNIGQRIEPTDFTEEEAQPLAAGIGGRDGTRLLKRILYWTGGHPYLTQRLCQAVAEAAGVTAASGVDGECERLFFSKAARETEGNLTFVGSRILRSEEDLASLLDLYRRVCSRFRKVKDDPVSPLGGILRLSGIVRVAQGYLRVRNRIYQRVFDREWIRQSMPDAERRRQRAAFRRGLVRAVAGSSVIVALLGGLAFKAVTEARRAVAERQRANVEADRAQRLLYVANMNLAQLAWDFIEVERVLELLGDTRPRRGQRDLRGFEWGYLWRLCHRDLRTIRVPMERDQPVAFSPGGNILATGGPDIPARLWDVQRGREIGHLGAHAGSIVAFAFSADGRWLAARDDTATLRVWDVAAGRGIRAFWEKPGQKPVEPFPLRKSSLALSKDGGQLATGDVEPIRLTNGRFGGFRGKVTVWDRAAGRPVLRLKGEGIADALAFSPDGRTLATVEEGTLKLWDIATGRQKRAFSGLAVNVRCIAFSPDGTILATGGEEHSVRVWEVAGGRAPATFKGHSGPVNALAFSPDGRILASGSDDTTIKLWDRMTGRELSTFEGHTGSVDALMFSRDGKQLQSLSDDGSVKQWEVWMEREALTLEGGLPVHCVAFSPDSRRLASAGGYHADDASGMVRLWEAATGRELRTQEPRGSIFVTRSVAFSPDGRRLATGGVDRNVTVWDAATGRKIRTLKGHADDLTSVAFSPDGRTLASGSADQTVKLWEATTGRELRTFKGCSHGLAFSPDGTLLGAAGQSDVVTIWNTATGRERIVLRGAAGPVAFSPDGTRMATAAGDNSNAIKLWDIATGRALQILKGHSQPVASVAFSPDGRTLATGSDDETVKLWGVETGREMLTLKGKGRSQGVTSVAFSPDGRTLAAGNNDSTIRLWRSIPMQEADAADAALLAQPGTASGFRIRMTRAPTALREYSLSTAPVLRYLPAGQAVVVLAERRERNQCRVAIGDLIGWIPLSELSIPPRPARTPARPTLDRIPAGQRVVQEALRWVGVPRYEWGGNRIERGIDTSHFVAAAYARVRQPCPSPPVHNMETCGAMVHWKPGPAEEYGSVTTFGPGPPLTDLRPGDRLIFQRDPSSRRDGNHHTGIYMGQYGNIKHAFIHCSSVRKTVAVNDLTSPRWWRIYRYAVRGSQRRPSASNPGK